LRFSYLFIYFYFFGPEIPRSPTFVKFNDNKLLDVGKKKVFVDLILIKVSYVFANENARRGDITINVHDWSTL
jgi:hypothetical protein